MGRLLRRYGWIVALVHACIGGACWIALPYLSAAEIGPTIGALGLLLSVYGTILTLVGFAITIAQLFRTQSAAKAAADAVESLKNSTSSFDSYYELARADALIGQIYSAITSRRSSDASRTFLDFRRTVARVLQLTPNLDGAAREALEGIMADIVAISAYFHDMGANAQPGFTSVEIKGRLANYRDVLTLIEVRLRGQIGA